MEQKPRAAARQWELQREGPELKESPQCWQVLEAAGHHATLWLLEVGGSRGKVAEPGEGSSGAFWWVGAHSRRSPDPMWVQL